MTWFLRSVQDQDTHQGEIAPDGRVAASCGARFTPYLLPQGGIALPTDPEDPGQICPECIKRPQDDAHDANPGP